MTVFGISDFGGGSPHLEDTSIKGKVVCLLKRARQQLKHPRHQPPRPLGNAHTTVLFSVRFAAAAGVIH